MRARAVLPPLALGVALVALWALLASAAGAQILPGPGPVLARLGVEITEGSLLTHAAITLGVALLGCLIGSAVSLPLAYLMSHFPTVQAALGPYLAASQAIPAVALAPLLVLWFGYGTFPTALLCTLMVFFPIAVNTVLGFTRLDPDLLGAARVDGADRWQLLAWIELPLALPAVLAGIRTGFVISITGAVVGELVMGGTGLGSVLASYRAAADTTGMVAVLLALLTCAVAVFGGVRSLERTIRW